MSPAREGSPRDFRDIATAITPELRRTAWLICGSSHAADDLVQESLVGLYVAMHRRRRMVDSPLAYARTILVRANAMSRRRKRSQELSVPPEAAARERSDVGPDVVATDIALSVTVQALLGELDAKDRAVLVLRYYCDLSVREVAESLSISEGSVRTRATRAKQRFRELAGSDLLYPSRSASPTHAKGHQHG